MNYFVSPLLTHFDLQNWLNWNVIAGWKVHTMVFRQADGYWMVVLEREEK